MATRRVDIRINVDDIDAGKRLDAIAAKLDKLSKGVYTIRLSLDDGGAKTRLDEIAAKLDKIGNKTYTPKIGMSGITKADAELDKLDARLDKIGRKRVTATVRVRTSGSTGSARSDFSKWEKELTGGGGRGGDGRAAGAAAGDTGFLSALGGANNSLFGGLIAALIAYGMAVGPAIIPFGLGGLTGGAGALAAGKLGTTGLAALKTDQQALAQAQAASKGKYGNTASNRLALQEAQAQLARDQARYGGFVPFGRQVSAVGRGAQNTLLGALTSSRGVPGLGGILTGLLSPLGAHGLGGPSSPTGGPVPDLRGALQGPFGMPKTGYQPSFLTSLSSILKQIDGFITRIGPGLANLFRASVPSLAAFVKIGEQFAMAMLPAMTQSLKAIQPDLPILVQGFKFLSEGIAGFITDLGPGMRDAAVIFKESMLVVKGLFQLVGASASVLAIGIVKTGDYIRLFAAVIPQHIDHMRHDIADIFDGIRHDTSAVWDVIWNNTIGRMERGVSDIHNEFDVWRHTTDTIFDGLRSDIAQAWDTIWSNTVGAVSHGYHTVLGWFDKFPGAIRGALGSLGSMLENIGKTALNDFLSGLKSVGGTVLSWFKSFIGGIPSFLMKLLHMSPPHPGSAFFDLGANFMHHLEAGVKSRASSVASAIHSAVGGPSGGSASAAAHYAQGLLSRYGWGSQWGALNSVAMRESGWSMSARNPSSGAYGIAQFINGPSEYYQYGGNPSTIAGQVTGFFNYIRQRYGDPNAAWAHELNYGWYDRGGILPQGLTLALNTTGHDEMINSHVTPMGGGGGGGNVYITVKGDTDPDGAALQIVKKLRKYKTRHGGAALGIG